MSTPHLDRLLFMQGGLCFFCRQSLPRGEASIEHLVASANGGANSEDNWNAHDCRLDLFIPQLRTI